jgi:hypothetical protein
LPFSSPLNGTLLERPGETVLSTLLVLGFDPNVEDLAIERIGEEDHLGPASFRGSHSSGPEIEIEKISPAFHRVKRKDPHPRQHFWAGKRSAEEM